mgnify:CR=1 FL=1
MSRKRKMASITSAGLVFAMLLSQSAVADLGTEQVIRHIWCGRLRSIKKRVPAVGYYTVGTLFCSL